MKTRKLVVLILAAAAPAWASPDPTESDPPRKLNKLTLDLEKQKVADLKTAGRVDELTLTGPYDGDW